MECYPQSHNFLLPPDYLGPKRTLQTACQILALLTAIKLSIAESDFRVDRQVTNAAS